MLGAYRFNGTFDDFLRLCGEICRNAGEKGTRQTTLGQGVVMVYFDSPPEGITLAFRKDDGRWQLSFLSHGEIERAYVRDEALK
jgi:hypothetical protein